MEVNRVLVVDDDPATRRVVSALLDLDEFGLLEAPTASPPWTWSGPSGPTWSSSTSPCRGWTACAPARPCALLGVQMVAGIKSLGHAVEVIRCHHERWDGRATRAGSPARRSPSAPASSRWRTPSTR
jgi:hypothetical protein